MANLLRRITQPAAEEERDILPYNFQQYLQDFFTYQGIHYGAGGYHQTLVGDDKEYGGDFGALFTETCRGNAIVFACMQIRLRHFTEARFQFRDVRSGKLFGTPELGILESPWPNATTGSLLGKMIQHVDLGGNSYTVRDKDRLAQLRPDWVDIMLGSRSGRRSFVIGDGDTEVIGYVYWPGGRVSGSDPITYAPFEIAHWAPVPDPEANYRGMSWLTPLAREIQGDNGMTNHKNAFLRNGATVNMVVKFQTQKEEDFNRAVQRFKEQHQGVANAYKALMVGTGTEIQPVGTDLAQMDFTNVQSAGELRIASAAQVPAVILGLREGLSGSTLNSGNFQQSRRMLSDVMRSLWREASGALATIIKVPTGAELWYDERGISFLKDDLADIAKVQQAQASAMSSAVQSGMDPQSIIAWLASDDITLLKPLEGLTTVQLQPINPTTGTQNGQPAPVQNGNGNGNGTVQLPPGKPPIVPAQSA